MTTKERNIFELTENKIFQFCDKIDSADSVIVAIRARFENSYFYAAIDCFPNACWIREVGECSIDIEDKAEAKFRGRQAGYLKVTLEKI